MAEDRGNFDVPELSEISWRNYLDGFFAEFYPVFEKHGISKGEALIVWELNKMDNELQELREAIEERPT